MPTPTLPWLPIKTERLVLREFSPADVDDVHRYASDPEVSRFMDWGPNALEDTQKVFEQTENKTSESPPIELELLLPLVTTFL